MKRYYTATYRRDYHTDRACFRVPVLSGQPQVGLSGSKNETQRKGDAGTRMRCDKVERPCHPPEWDCGLCVFNSSGYPFYLYYL